MNQTIEGLKRGKEKLNEQIEILINNFMIENSIEIESVKCSKISLSTKGGTANIPTFIVRTTIKL